LIHQYEKIASYEIDWWGGQGSKIHAVFIVPQRRPTPDVRWPWGVAEVSTVSENV